MAYKSIVLFLIALLTSSFSNAGEATLTWTPPTQNEDGTPLSDLASYKIYSGCSVSGVYERPVETVTVAASSYIVSGLPDTGTCYFAAKAVNSSNVPSVYSNEATKVFSVAQLPGPVLDTEITWAESLPAQNLVISNTQPANYVWGILAEGELSHIDRDYIFVTVPAELTGLDYLRTAMADKDVTGLGTVSFNVNRSVTVFIAYDRDFSMDSPPTFPSWLTSWTNTGLGTATNDDTSFDIYSKDFPVGQVVLGGNNDSGIYTHSMYNVMVK